MDSASWKERIRELETAASSVSDESRFFHTRSQFDAAVEKVLKNFDTDYVLAQAQLETLLPSLAADNRSPESRVEKIAALLDSWIDEGGPSTPALMAAYMDRLGTGPDGSSAENTALITGLLAEIPNENPYHGNWHFREVVALNMVLLHAEEEMGYTDIDPIEQKLQLYSDS